MGSLLHNGTGEDRHDREDRAARRLLVNGEAYANAASKFWTALADEADERFGPGTEIELSALSGSPLRPRMLHPGIVTDEDLKEWVGADMDEAMRATLAELELTGPPSSVAVVVRHGGSERLRSALPADCLDGETFPYMLVWLPAWSGLKPDTWDRPVLAGSFRGEEVRGKRSFAWSYRLQQRHVHEGLREFRVAVTCSLHRR